MGLMNELAYIRNQLGKGSLPYLGNEMRYFANQLSRGLTPYANVQRPPMPGLPADYKQTELAAGAAAERFRPGAGFPGQQGMFTPAAPGPGTTPPAVLDPYAAQNRAYQQERARVEAMVKANPDMQKQEIADARAKVRDQGMAIWQQKYGNTPMGQPGGAIGQKNPLMEEFFGYQTGMAPDQIAAMQETAAPVQVAPGEIPYQQGDLGTRATLETGYDPAQYGLSPNLVEEMKKRLLQQAGK